MSGMTRAGETFLALTFAGTVYSALYFAPEMFLLPKESDKYEQIVPYIPFWAVIAIACYLLGRLGYGVLIFNDTKGAYKELMGDSDNGIEGAKKALKARGVGTD
ncbi:putative dolichyl-phosphate mannosyltransferase polypeptide 3 [Phaeomoniella chlamydospora]|uniref:Dolichol-phosphate mannosyltransferase subunit 3 n=1 Tax=Phaeomoniella chlamydospora TaxID=158046 RepID=A0A0G2DTU9_PHACM|nr:putative dolichyl-phosphate mannosyltransferase polypeptide 3 [Phaeomoniella chlamydospora]